jgi:hypothetical protein
VVLRAATCGGVAIVDLGATRRHDVQIHVARRAPR